MRVSWHFNIAHFLSLLLLEPANIFHHLLIYVETNGLKHHESSYERKQNWGKNKSTHLPRTRHIFELLFLVAHYSSHTLAEASYIVEPHIEENYTFDSLLAIYDLSLSQ